ncbi:hypothetical protein [Candidatus Palauibacter sp.]|uniref:hypothetical protein n=1 Tax=Candidatus Palauibacter sp. TaxID=3101350 RepID=UPI003B526762
MHIPLTSDQALDLAQRYSELPSYEAGVSNGQADEQIERRFQTIRGRGHMVPEDLRHIAKWKYPGKALVNLVEKNTQIEVTEISRASFSATTERLRVGALLALHGVGWPMASVILHFAFPDRYPMLDKRVMRVVGVPHAYSFARWVEYTDLCREASRRLEVSLRVLDRALWTLDRTSTPDGTTARRHGLSVDP